jgi:hypothetical protein
MGRGSLNSLLNFRMLLDGLGEKGEQARVLRDDIWKETHEWERMGLVGDERSCGTGFWGRGGSGMLYRELEVSPTVE